VFSWLAPSLVAVLLYGVGQGLIKKWIVEVLPARFCIYLMLARGAINLSFFFAQPHPSLLAPDGHAFLGLSVLAAMLDGTAWIFYFGSIVAGPITIVGTLSAAYPALTVVFASAFLGEHLRTLQYIAVATVIAGSLGLSYMPAEAGVKRLSRRWIPLALTALILWASSQTLIKYAYTLPEASEVNLAFCSAVGAALTLGTFGLWKGHGGGHSFGEWWRSFLPMGLMGAGDLGVIIATRYGPISVVTPLSGAYPVVTLAFAAVVLKERIRPLQLLCTAAIILGMFFCTS
jgi:drug/metabolite transporter (DMT)-like permease